MVKSLLHPIRIRFSRETKVSRKLYYINIGISNYDCWVQVCAVCVLKCKSKSVVYVCEADKVLVFVPIDIEKNSSHELYIIKLLGRYVLAQVNYNTILVSSQCQLKHIVNFKFFM